MTNKLSHYQSLIILLICIIIHAFLLFIIAIVHLDNSQEATVILADQEEQLHEQPSEHDWVALANNIPAMHKAQTQQPSMPTQEQQEPEKTAQEVAQQTPQPETKSKPTEQAIEESIEQAVQMANQVLAQSESDNVPQQAKPDPETEIKKEREPKTEIAKQINKNQSQTAPALTLAQLTEGFLQHLQESPMAVQSDRQGNASMEQLQHMHYCQKIIDCIVNSYKINKTRTISSDAMQQAARIHLALNKNGSISILTIVQSSGNITIDQFLLHMFSDASSSFPPLPSSFNEQPYHLPTFNVDHLESFQSTNGWYIDNKMQ